MHDCQYKPVTAQHQIDTIRLDWLDARRDRKIPVKIYTPRVSVDPAPVIIFSHGLGGSREGYGFLGRHWASHGYVVVHPQHLGSDQEIWQHVSPGEVLQAMRSAVRPDNAADRVLDMLFILDQLDTLGKDQRPWPGNLDLKNIGVAGHSYGAMTSLAIAGQVFLTPKGPELCPPDPRVKAALAMSSPVPKNKNHWEATFAKIRIPCLHMTGTDDVTPLAETTAAERRVPFDHTTSADACLITFEAGDHMVFAGMTRNAARREKDAIIHGLIKSSSLAFWDGMLKGNVAARKWLTEGGFESCLANHGSFEVKLAR